MFEQEHFTRKCSIVMCLRFDGMFNYCPARNLLQSLQVKDFWKLVWHSDGQKYDSTFFLTQCHIFLVSCDG